MPKIAVVTDSTSDMPQGAAEQLGIKVVPLNVHFGNEVFTDGVDIFPEEFYHKLESSHSVPRTSQPAPGDFLKTYQDLIAKGFDTIISVHLSSKLSGTIGSAQLAKSMMEDADIRIVDSCFVTTALGLMAMEAAKLVNQGADVETVLTAIEDRRKRQNLIFVVDTLEYLQKNGRIGKASSLLGTLLSIKPILTVTDGVITPFEKTRGKNKAIKRMVDVVAENRLGRDRSDPIAVIHASYPEDALDVKREILGLGLTDEVILSEIGPVVGVHSGPGAIGIVF